MNKIKIISVKNLWLLITDSTKEFIEDKGVKLSAALAYYTIFSIPPLMIIITSVTGLFYGDKAALQIQEAIQNTVIDHNSWWANILSIAALILGATGVFVEIQDSINIIWGLKAKPKKGLIKMIINRLISFSMIISIGFLLLVSLVLNALLDIFNAQLQSLFPETAFYAFYIINILLILFVITLLFAIIFKVLPDAKIKWKSVLWGAFFTAILFLLGKMAIGFYLGSSSIGSVYGAAGSVIIIIVWVYYSAIILFYGAEFTQVHAQRFGTAIQPNKYAVFIVNKEIELDKSGKTGNANFLK
ncbi:MAG TPA: YihY/virulence factor BrkB family protein [Bacteroidia bacterium]|nr:YihY/virulence factor BrkB family protein [Bacteroidia bacterium]